MAYSVDVTSALAFGKDLNTLERGDGELQAHIARVFELLARRILSPVPYWRYVKPPADRAAEHSLEVLRERSPGSSPRPATAWSAARAPRGARELPREHARRPRATARPT